jgi:hypothetical protein
VTNRLRLSAVAAILFAVQPFTVTGLSAADTAVAPADKQTADPKAEKPKPKMICHREIPTGAIAPVKVCRTQEQIDAEAQRSQSQLDDMNRMRQQSTGSVRGG